MSSYLRTATLASVLALALAACGSGGEGNAEAGTSDPASELRTAEPPGQSTAHAGVEAMRMALGEAGIPCDPFEVTADTPQLVSGRAFCTVDGERLVFWVFPPEYRDAIATYSQLIGAGAIVTGANWSVRAQSADLAETVAVVLGGTVTAVPAS